MNSIPSPSISPSPSPSLQQTAPATVTSTPTVIGTYIPSINATIAELRFFESDSKDAPATDQRIYKSRFLKAETRYVFWQLDLKHPARSTRKDFSIYAVYYRPDGSVLTAHQNNTYIDPSETATWHYGGYGNADPGVAYGVGSYKVDLRIDGNQVVSGWFEIY